MLAHRDFGISLLLHGAFILLALNWAPPLRPVPAQWHPLPVELVPVSELTRLQKKNETPPTPSEEAVKQQPAPAKPKPVEKAPAPEVVPEAKSEPVPEKASKPVPEPEKKAPPPPVVAPEPEPQDRLKIDQIQALLDKTPDAPKAPEASPEVAELTISEIDSFRAQMRRCWSFPSGARDGSDLIIEISLSLSSTGAVSRGPVITNRQRLSDPYFRAAAESVLRAILRCQPFTMPVDKYEHWRDLELRFDPRHMLGE